jgi:1,4-dihydroxy-2-naphthoate polyprenyltransferase
LSVVVAGSLKTWWRGARPRTLGAGVAPVIAGAAAAGHVIWWRLLAALIVALGLQIGVNLANDYFDGVRGVDTSERLGPPRLVSSGTASAGAVLAVSLSCIGVAAVAGLALALATTPALILITGALALLAAIGYSGGPKPYASLGLGELMVLLFFGLFATCGTAYVMVLHVPAAAWWCGTSLGLLAVAILVANNLRDIPTDEASGKRTLAVRLGDRRTRDLYRFCVIGAFATIVLAMVLYIPWPWLGATQWILFGLAAWPLAIKPMQAVARATGRELIPVLTGTAATHAACGALLALGLVLSRTVHPVAHPLP